VIDYPQGFLENHERIADAGKLLTKGKPTTWMPVSRNPAKLTQHYFDNGTWVRTRVCKLVAWPEKFGAAGSGG
jgi:hypothetical protein